MTAITRRRALTGSAAIAVGVPVVAACGASVPATPDGQAGAAGASGTVLADVSDVPEGGCFVATAPNVVVTQPSAGNFKAFSATCTHQGCPVSTAVEGIIPCRCHGSQFSLTDGTVVRGPAMQPLAEVKIAVDGDVITVA